MIKHICDCCELGYDEKDDCPTYTMFFCDSYGGEAKEICKSCEIKLHKILDTRDESWKGTFRVEGCTDGKFFDVECLESNDSYGFFKDENDVRPSSCVWVKKEEAEKVGAVLYNKFIECIGEAALNETIVDRKRLLNLINGAKNDWINLS